MSFIVTDLQQLYKQTFYSKPYQVQESAQKFSQANGSELVAKYKDKDIWLPVKFKKLDVSVFGISEILLPYVTINISGKKNIVKTSLAERQGTVKELYAIDDYTIAIKGFLIDDKNRVWPEDRIIELQKIFTYPQALQLENALTNLFLNAKENEDQCRVVVESFDMPEVSGGRKHIRPFTMRIESDSVFQLELI